MIAIRLALVAFLALAGAAAAQSPQTAAATPRIPAPELAKLYNSSSAGRARAVEVYSGREVRIDGEFVSYRVIEGRYGEIRVSAKADSKSFVLACELRNGTPPASFGYQLGDAVSFVGVWDGRAQLGYYLAFNPCRVLPNRPNVATVPRN